MVKNITYSKLREALADLGYTPRSAGRNAIVFRNPDRRLMAILPEMRDEEFVPPAELGSTHSTLVDDGVLKNDYSFDSLFLIRKGDRLLWTDSETKKETKVTAAAAGESDGLVVVKQKGALLPCRVDQVRRVKRAARAARK